jgi:hypothetical protein
MARYRVGLVIVAAGDVVEVTSVAVEATSPEAARARVDVAMPARYTVEIAGPDPFEDIAALEVMGRDGIGPLRERGKGR